jgi:hypothetical protein
VRERGERGQLVEESNTYIIYHLSLAPYINMGPDAYAVLGLSPKLLYFYMSSLSTCPYVTKKEMVMVTSRERFILWHWQPQEEAE